MKNSLFILAACVMMFAVSCGISYAEIVDAKIATVKNVTVLPDRAEEIRTVEVSLAPGINKVAVKPFSSQTMFDTLRVKVISNTNTALYAINISSVPVPEPPMDKYRDLTEKITALQEEIAALNDNASVISAKIDLINKLYDHMRKVSTASLSAGNPVGAGVNEKLDLFVAQIVDNRLLLNNIKKTLTDKSKQLEALINERNAAYGSSRARETIATIEIESAVATSATIELKYFVAACWWRPDYDFNLLPGATELDIRYSAVVYQGTGMDWEGVKMTLATTTPSLQLVPPTFGAWTVSTEPPQPKLAWDAKPAAKSALRSAEKLKELKKDSAEDSMGFVDAEMAEEAENQMALVTPSSGGLAVSFALPSESYLKSGAQAKFQIAMLNLKTNVRRYIVPRFNNEVFVRAITVNTSDFPMLPGYARCFIEGAMTGGTVLNRVPTGVEFKLPMGYDRRIKVERKEVRNEKEERGKKIRHHFKYAVELTNNADLPLLVEMVDQIPVSQHGDIKIDKPKYNIKPTKETEEGILTWEFTMNPKAKSLLEIEYYIEYPADMELAIE